MNPQLNILATSNSQSSRNNLIYNNQRQFEHMQNNNCFKLIINHNECDTLIPKYLVFNLNSDTNINNFINSIENSKFKMIINNVDLINHYLSLYTKLYPVDNVISNSFVVKIPFESLFDKLNIFECMFHNIEFQIENLNNENFASINLICTNTFEFERRLDNTTLYRQNFIYQDIDNNNDDRLLNSISLNFDFIIRGYFLECNVQKLSNLSISFNRSTLFNYNKTMINLFTKKINDKLLYIPLNNNFNYEDYNIDNFLGAINHSRFDRVTMDLEWETPPGNLRLWANTACLIRYNNGLFNYSCGNFINHQLINSNNAVINMIQNNLSLGWPETIQNNTQSNNTEWPEIIRIIDTSRNLTCPISFEEFTTGCRYCFCNTCNNNFMASPLRIYFNNRHSNNCPICRTPWTNNNIYINS
jgi:hypothetical protein